jgi:sulfide:quinone oxidoreductase
MEPKAMTSTLSVDGQISAADVRRLAEAGFRSVLCNRPDGEEPGQPGFDEIEAAARQAGLEARYLPISGAPSDEIAADFGQALEQLPAPVFAYCRSGLRSATAWALSQATARSVADLLVATKAAGYDIGAVVPRIAAAGRVPAGRDGQARVAAGPCE